MVWWWIGDALLLFAVIPLVLFLLNRVLRPARQIGKYAADILDHGVALTGELESLTLLETTRDLARQAVEPATRYVSAVEGMLYRELDGL
jgi:hypothetical protein